MNQAERFSTYTKILNEELMTALGCTEPIALALTSAKCVEVLGGEPEAITVNLSGNIIKNVQGVIIPGTKDLKGVELSVLLGAVIGDSSQSLEILNGLTDAQIEAAHQLKAKRICTIVHAEDKPKLYIDIHMTRGNNRANVEVMHQHTNITKVIKNGEEIVYNPCQEENLNSALTDRQSLSISGIYDYAHHAPLDSFSALFANQIEKNLAIAQEGLDCDYGLNTGKNLLKYADGSVKEKMKAYGAGGSDARMSGCDLPVVINSGSGNQGLTITSPVYTYCREHNIETSRMYRALAMANLVPIHLKTRIGRLSAFCGAVTAGIGVGCAVTFLRDGSEVQVGNTIKNCLANLMGVICDGAKPSCALKIASSIDAAVMASQLAMEDKVVEAGTGIIYGDVEDTIKNMAEIAFDAMTETDEKILKIMVNATSH